MRNKGSPNRVGDLVSGVLSKVGVLEQVRRQSVLVEWADLVGERIADVTRAREVSGRALFVEVRSSAWLMELNTMKQEIMRRINAGRTDGRVEKLVFVLAERWETE